MSAPAPASNSTAPSPSTTVLPPSPSSTNATTPAPSTTPSPPPPPVSSPPPPATPAPSISPPPPTAPPPSTSPPPPPSTVDSPPPPSTVDSPPPPPSSPSTTPSPPLAPKTPSTLKSSPPPPPPSPSSSSGSSPSSSGVSTGLMVGIAIGGVVVLAVFCLFFICRRKKTRRRRYDDEGAFYGRPPAPPPPGPKVDPYGDRQQHWQQNHPPPSNHVVAAMPMPPPPPPFASRLQHPAERISTPPPPPPPLFLSSSGGSGSNYSGSENPLPPPSPGIGLSFSRSIFTYEELARATEGFSDANLLGQGGFGFVHKGILPNGKEVAVKQLKAGSGQGEREFRAEVDIISRVHHKHLVSLVGYCITGAQRLLVYEFVANNNLEFHLHGSGRPTMEWPTRLKIALGSAKGLAYLHEDCHPKIIHRDIKAANILLDYKFEAMVADFGLAKFTDDINTHVSTRVMGTFGYMAPEYASSGKLTDKSDVFSFGIMLLELITGKKPVDPTPSFKEDCFVDWARPLLSKALNDGNFDTLADHKMENGYDHNEMARMVASAAACVRHSAKNRPRMSQVVRALEGDMSLSDLNEEIRPGNSRVHSSHGSSDYDTRQYNEDMKKFRKMALGSQEYTASGEYSEPSSQHGLQPSGSSGEGQNTREMEMGKFKGNSQGFSGSSQ